MEGEQKRTDERVALKLEFFAHRVEIQQWFRERVLVREFRLPFE